MVVRNNDVSTNEMRDIIKIYNYFLFYCFDLKRLDYFTFIASSGFA